MLDARDLAALEQHHPDAVVEIVALRLDPVLDVLEHVTVLVDREDPPDVVVLGGVTASKVDRGDGVVRLADALVDEHGDSDEVPPTPCDGEVGVVEEGGGVEGLAGLAEDAGPRGF